MAWKISAPIVVPFDFSDHAIDAVKTAIELAEDPNQIHILHVLAFMNPTEPGVVWGTIDDDSRIKHTHEALIESLGQYEGLNMHVRIGDPGSVTAQLAQELNAGLVVVGSHGRTGIQHFLLGSVAERVARLTHCPVLIVKQPA